MKRLLALAGLLVAALVAAGAAGRVLSSRGTYGDDDADDVSMTTVLGGIQRSLRGERLARVRAVARLGGIDLDLREATLAPEGADVVLDASMGGIKVTVPNGWRVEAVTEAIKGGIDVRTADPATLPADAPTLRVVARARKGGIVVEAVGAPGPAEGGVSPDPAA